MLRMTSRNAERWSGLLLVLAAVVLMALVVPAVRADFYAGATPELAVVVLGAVAAADAFLAMLLLVPAWQPRSGRVTRVAAWVRMALYAVLTLAMVDAAGAYSGHGDAMKAAVLGLVLVALAHAGVVVLGWWSARPRPAAAPAASTPNATNANPLR